MQKIIKKIINIVITIVMVVFLGGLIYDLTHPVELTPAQRQHLKSYDKAAQKGVR